MRKRKHLTRSLGPLDIISLDIGSPRTLVPLNIRCPFFKESYLNSSSPSATLDKPRPVYRRAPTAGRTILCLLMSGKLMSYNQKPQIWLFVFRSKHPLSLLFPHFFWCPTGHIQEEDKNSDTLPLRQYLTSCFGMGLLPIISSYLHNSQA